MRDLVSENLSRLSFGEGLLSVELNLLLTTRQEVLAVVLTCGSQDLSSDMLPRDTAIVALRITTVDRSVYYPSEQMAEQNALL